MARAPGHFRSHGIQLLPQSRDVLPPGHPYLRGLWRARTLDHDLLTEPFVLGRAHPEAIVVDRGRVGSLPLSRTLCKPGVRWGASRSPLARALRGRGLPGHVRRRAALAGVSSATPLDRELLAELFLLVRVLPLGRWPQRTGLRVTPARAGHREASSARQKADRLAPTRAGFATRRSPSWTGSLGHSRLCGLQPTRPKRWVWKSASFPLARALPRRLRCGCS